LYLNVQRGIDPPIAASDSQGNPDLRKITRNLSLTFAAFGDTGLSRPVETCERPITECDSARAMAAPDPPSGTPPTMIVRLVADIQNTCLQWATLASVRTFAPSGQAGSRVG